MSEPIRIFDGPGADHAASKLREAGLEVEIVHLVRAGARRMTSDRPEHTARALEICAEHWTPELTRCHGCPIKPECWAPTVPLTVDRLREHVDAVNAAAEEVQRT